MFNSGAFISSLPCSAYWRKDQKIATKIMVVSPVDRHGPLKPRIVTALPPTTQFTSCRPPFLEARMTKRSVPVSYEDLSSRFDKPLSDVAVELGVCMTFLKKTCRKHNIKRWPFRKVRGGPLPTSEKYGGFCLFRALPPWTLSSVS